MPSPKPANPDEIALYCYMGEALCKTQLLEQALSHCITLKLNSDVTREAADEHLNELGHYTLGKAIHLSAKENLFNESLQRELYKFLDQRNWLVHKVLAESKHDMYKGVIREEVCDQIKAVATAAETLQRAIEMDMINFCEAKGKDMESVKARGVSMEGRGIRLA